MVLEAGHLKSRCRQGHVRCEGSWGEPVPRLSLSFLCGQRSWGFLGLKLYHCITSISVSFFVSQHSPCVSLCVSYVVSLHQPY